MNPIRFIVNLFPRRTVAPIPCYKSFFANSTIAMHPPCFGNSCPDTAFIKFQSHDPWPSDHPFSFHRSHLRPALVRRTMSDTIETATLYEHRMRSSSRSDEEQLEIEFRPVTATSDPHWYEGCRQALPARGKHSKSKNPGRTSSVCRSAVARRFQSLPHFLDLRQRRLQRHFRRSALVAFIFKATLLPRLAFAPSV